MQESLGKFWLYPWLPLLLSSLSLDQIPQLAVS